MFVVQFNDGRVFCTDIAAEARLYAWLSTEFSICNVYKRGWSGTPLSQYEI